MMFAENNLDIQNRSTSDSASEPKWRIDTHAIRLSHHTKWDWSTALCHHRFGETAVVIEWRGPFTNSEDVKANENRLDRLCELLCAMHTADSDEKRTHTPQLARNADFGTLKCLGWVMPEIASKRIGIVFQSPLQQSREPKPLSEKMSEMRMSRMASPSLGDRFDLAFGICSAMVNIITVGWAHRAVRSENMLIFDERGIRNVYLVGFTYARPSDAGLLSRLPGVKKMLLYRPPIAAEDAPLGDMPYTGNGGIILGDPGMAAHDLYGLGVVLLEIGLWITVDMLMDAEKTTDVFDFQTLRLEKYIAQLSARCGDIYSDVVRKCLSADTWDNESLKVKMAEIVVSLSQCRA